MRRLGLVLSAGALLLVSVACGGNNEEIGFGGQPSPPPESSAQRPQDMPEPQLPPGTGAAHPAPPVGSIQVADSKVDSSALPPGYPNVVWTESDGLMVGAFGQAGGCVEATGSVTEQSAQRVVFLITETTTSTGMCTMDIRYPPLAVKLDSPLGERTVVLQRTQVGPS